MLQLVDSEKNPMWMDFNNQLLIDSFPMEERPSLDVIIKRNPDQFCYNTIVDNDQPLGLLSYWKLNGFVYIEHFAIDKTKRNNNIGSYILSQFISEQKEPVVLEVELPTNETAQRRIGFYKRLGFIVQPYHYMQPPYRPSESPIQLLLLATNHLSELQFTMVRDHLYHDVYEVNK